MIHLKHIMSQPVKNSTPPCPSNTVVQIVCRQTNYDEETSIQKLNEHDQNVEAVIREFHGIQTPSSEEQSSSKSTNQKIFKAMRDFF